MTEKEKTENNQDSKLHEQAGNRESNSSDKNKTFEAGEVETGNELSFDQIKTQLLRQLREKESIDSLVKTIDLFEAQSKNIEQKLEEEKSAAQDKILRLTAEIHNLQKSHRREIENSLKFANKEFAQDILFVVDCLEQALSSDQSNKNDLVQRKGIELTLQVMEQTLGRFGVEPMKIEGKEYDPEIAEAIALIPSKLKKNTILSISQRGWYINGMLLRAAKVQVASEESN